MLYDIFLGLCVLWLLSVLGLKSGYGLCTWIPNYSVILILESCSSLFFFQVNDITLISFYPDDRKNFTMLLVMFIDLSLPPLPCLNASSS